MKVILAGYNVDKEVIEELKKTSPPRDDITPETLSASYARISRDPRPAYELRAAARKEVEKARRSNRNIIFKMGHHSVAEHAVFNFDIIGISRLALEELERFRLCSYTEKSQRYITLKDDFVVPEEIKKAGMEEIFCETIQEQNALYHRLYKKLRPYFFETYKNSAEVSRKHRILEGWAKEDARYVVSLATQGQLGMSINGRNLEFLIRRFSSKKLAEIRELNSQLHSLAKEVAPSILLFTEASDFDARTYLELEKKAAASWKDPADSGQEVRLVDFTPQADIKLIASLLHTVSSHSYPQCLERARSLKSREKKDFMKAAFKHMEFYDAVPREFEYVDLTFDLMVSATCFAQLKRHRMTTQTTQKYNPELGVTIPPSIMEIGARKEFMDMMEKTNRIYFQLQKKIDRGADYILTNAHRKRVLIKVNARELYHISRLREDAAAQWDIRSVAADMSRLAKEKMPLTFLLIGGKDAYPEVYEKIFQKRPEFIPPKL